MTGPAGDSPTPTADPAPVRLRRTGPHPGPARWTVAAVVAVVVGVGLVSAAVSTPTAATPPATAGPVGIPPSDAGTSSAFCTAGAGHTAASTVYLTNTTGRPVGGVMTAVGGGSGGAVSSARRSVAVPAFGTVALDPTTGLRSGDYGASFSFAGGGVVATQVVSGPLGWSTSPCATGTSPEWAFAGGSTLQGNAMYVTLYNPAAPDAVVNVTFLTPSGEVTPQAYQGLVVPSGGLATLDVGQYVQRATDIATLVNVQSGAVVSSQFDQYSQGTTTGLSLRLGSSGPSSDWQFAQTTVVTGSTVSFDLANPGTTPVTATVTVGLTSGSVVPRRVPVAPQSVTHVVVSGAIGLPQQIPFSVDVDASGPVVVGRSVLAPRSAPSPGWGSSSGTVTATTHWLIPGPGVARAPGTAHASVRSLAVADPGPSPAQVTVSTLGSGGPVSVFTVAPGRLVVLDTRAVRGLSTFTVGASQPVVVEEDSRPSGAPGVVSSAGFPFPG